MILLAFFVFLTAVCLIAGLGGMIGSVVRGHFGPGDGTTKPTDGGLSGYYVPPNGSSAV